MDPGFLERVSYVKMCQKCVCVRACVRACVCVVVLFAAMISSIFS